MGTARQAKKRLKSAAKRAARALRPVAGSLPVGGRILTFHSIADRDDELCVRPALFREQLAWLKDTRPVIPLAEAARGEDGVAITFDDGYRDNWEIAAPILREFDLSATFFLVSGYLDGDAGTHGGPWLTWDQARELAAAGFEIGGHSHTHPRMARLSEDRQAEELRINRERIAAELGQVPAAFAYPYGTLLDYTLETERLVAEAGFVCACTNRYGVNRPETDPFNLWRINIDGSDTRADFQAKVNGALDAWRWVDSPLLARLRQGLDTLVGA